MQSASQQDWSRERYFPSQWLDHKTVVGILVVNICALSSICFLWHLPPGTKDIKEIDFPPPFKPQGIWVFIKRFLTFAEWSERLRSVCNSGEEEQCSLLKIIKKNAVFFLGSCPSFPQLRSTCLTHTQIHLYEGDVFSLLLLFLTCWSERLFSESAANSIKVLN